VLLLHGLGASGASWGFQIPALTAAGYHVIAPDIRGFGQSSYPGGKVTIQALADDVGGLLQTTCKPPAYVVGISMGGVIALQLALDAPQLVKKLVLINTFARLQLDRPSLWVYFGLRFILLHTLGIHAQARAVARRIFPLPSRQALREELVREIVQSDPRGYKATMRALARFNVLNRLSDLRMPVLVVTGECDTTVPRAAQNTLAQLIPGATQVTIPDAGHGVIAEQPDLFNQTLLDFLK